jgi:poly-gamma-glutamate synthesis protein (capsule biosynthesis protein)
MGIKITIGGDFCITPPYLNKNLISKTLTNLFNESDINIVNLECPIIENGNNLKILKTGPHIYSKKEIFIPLKKLKIDAVTLANNHILDYGPVGVATTIEQCSNNKILGIGAGLDLYQAAKPAIIEKKGVRIALLNFCENEWSIAKNECAGANPFNIIDNLKQIQVARNLAELVIVIIHGGHEYYNLPSPNMVKTYRFFAENGADAIIGHHPHCIGGYEFLNKVPIIYSLGNMLFTKPNRQKKWYTGLIVQLDYEKNKQLKIELHPIHQSEQTFQVTLLKDNAKTEVLNRVSEYSDIIKNENNLYCEWKQFVKSKKRAINLFSPLNILPGRYFKAALNRLGFNKILLPEQYLVRILNHIRCEAHRDILVESLQSKFQKDENCNTSSTT